MNPRFYLAALLIASVALAVLIANLTPLTR